MTPRRSEFERFLDQDIDDLLEYARTLGGRRRTAVFDEARSRLDHTSDQVQRIKILRFLQTLLAELSNGRLPASAAEPAALDLSRVVSSLEEHIEVRRAALDVLALLFLKAKELTPLADSRIRAAFAGASSDSDSQLREFARAALSRGGVLGRRMISRHYRYVYVSGIATAESKESHRDQSHRALH